VKLKLSDRDLVYIAVASSAVPWSGGEAGVLQRYDLEKALNLARVRKLVGPLEQQSDVAKPVELTRDQVELLVFCLCGGGGALKGEGGPVLGELIARIRVTAPKPKRPEPPKRPPAARP
jgi:hypothetical protein